MKVKRTGGNSPAEKYMVPVVRSTFRILEELSKAGELALNEVTRRSGVSKSTVFRILTTLTRIGYVLHDDGGNYFVSRTLAGLVSETAGTEALRRIVLRHMLKLRDQYGETVILGQLQMDKVTYVEVVPSEYALRLNERPGATIAAHASALGKVILAFSPPDLVEALVRGRELQMLTSNTITSPDELMVELRRVRERGYALDRGEASPLACCVGAPILDAQRAAIAAVSISGPTARFKPRANSPVIESLLLATAEISRELSARPPLAR